MADKVLIPGVIGLTNYRSRFTRPMYGTIRSGTLAGSGARRANQYYMRRNRQGYYIPMGTPLRTAVRTYAGPPSRTKKRQQYKKTCCRYYRGKKYCSPRFCAKKKYWY